MAIQFENIDTGETASIDRQSGGNYYRAKLSALMNSSNLNVNSDRGQDYGWRLKPEQQAILEQWEQDVDVIDKVSAFTKAGVDDLTHAEFLSYMLHQQEAGKSPEVAQEVARRDKQADYLARVEAIKAQEKPEIVPAFEAPKTAKK